MTKRELIDALAIYDDLDDVYVDINQDDGHGNTGTVVEVCPVLHVSEFPSFDGEMPCLAIISINA